MRTGETVTDDGGATWTLGERVGRGAWGASWEVIAQDGRRAILKVPLGPADFPADAPIPDGAAELCIQCLREQAAALSDTDSTHGPRLETQLTLDGDIPALVMPRYETLTQRLQDHATLREIIETLVAVANALHKARTPHGTLRPSNILSHKQKYQIHNNKSKV